MIFHNLQKSIMICKNLQVSIRICKNLSESFMNFHNLSKSVRIFLIFSESQKNLSESSRICDILVLTLVKKRECGQSLSNGLSIFMAALHKSYHENFAPNTTNHATPATSINFAHVPKHDSMSGYNQRLRNTMKGCSA